MTPSDLSRVRTRFPGLALSINGRPCVFADAPGGSQVPDTVIEAMAGYLRRSNANAHGAFLTSHRTDDVIREAHRAAADFLGSEPDEVVFGPNATTLLFHISRSIARTLGPGDEIVVTNLDHDANVAPWLLIAEDTGAAIRWADIRMDDVSLDLGSLDAALSGRTKVVAFTAASNAVGSVTPAGEIARRAHAAGAIAVVDAVHFAQHRLIDVADMGADVLVCSPYKFFGTHLGILFGRRQLLAGWRPYKVRPAPDELPGRWETGTQNHEGMAGFIAAVDYVASIDSTAVGERRIRLARGFEAIRAHETLLSERFLKGLTKLQNVNLYGIGDAGRIAERTPTFAVRVGDRHPADTAKHLAERGIFVWDGNYYALTVMERLGLESSGGAVRIGFCHYNSMEEVDRVLAALADLA